MIRLIFSHGIAVYLGAGVFAASLMGSAIPAINWLGYAYITAAWPHMVYCAPVERGCDPMPPQWMNGYVFDDLEAKP